MNFVRKFATRSVCPILLSSTLLKTNCESKKAHGHINPDKFRPDPNLYERIDHEMHQNVNMKTDHALHETLYGDSMIEGIFVLHKKPSI